MMKREDLLELTRRMTPKRNCFTRTAGAYLTPQGEIDGTYNIHFQKLSPAETAQNLKLAKTVPFAGGTGNLREYDFPSSNPSSANMWQMLLALTACELKNDAMLENLYELIGETCRFDTDFAVSVFHGNYDVPGRAGDNAYLHDSDLVYSFLICTVSPLEDEYVPGDPQWGFLFPSFSNRRPDTTHIAVFEADPLSPHREFNSGVLFL